MAAILPEKFKQGDFRIWLRQFEVCADANGWTEPQRLRKLPAFLRGLAAAHFYVLKDEQRDTYPNLIANLTAALCPAICRETYYTEFGERMLRSGEDPSVYLWALQELLAKAEPTLTADAQAALLGRQFMKGLPNSMRFKLLEHNPVPSLNEMVTFSKQFLAVRSDASISKLSCAATTTPVSAESPSQPEPVVQGYLVHLHLSIKL
eukprot:gene11676-biopygen9348